MCAGKHRQETIPRTHAMWAAGEKGQGRVCVQKTPRYSEKMIIFVGRDNNYYTLI